MSGFADALAGIDFLKNRYLSSLIAVAAIGFFAFYEIDGQSAGLAFWLLFGVGTFLLVIAVWLVVEAAIAVARFQKDGHIVDSLDIEI